MKDAMIVIPPSADWEAVVELLGGAGQSSGTYCGG